MIHLNILFLLGLALFGGTIGGRIFQKARFPQVVGYIIIGIVIGDFGLGIVNQEVIVMLMPFSYFALALIGFMIGGELKKDVLLKYGRQLTKITLIEGLLTFFSVALLVSIFGGLLSGNWKFSWAIGILLGAISSASAPAPTIAVLRDYKARGPLTRTILGIVAMDDALAIFLFAFASSIAAILMGAVYNNTLSRVLYPAYEIGASIVVGIIAGLILSFLLRRYPENESLLVFSIGAILLVAGLALTFNIDILMAMMVLGAVVINSVPRRGKEVFRRVDYFTSPIYVLFFVLVGAKLVLRDINAFIFVLILVYLFARTLGKMAGAFWGAKIAGAAKSVQRYLPLCLFSQAGIAIGLSLLASNYFPGEIGNQVVIIIAATVFILEISGPFFIRIGLTRAQEVGLNITEEDFISTTMVKEIMDRNPPLIHENTPLEKILEIFSQTANLYYPVVNDKDELAGIISVDTIKNTILESGASGLILAADLKEENPFSITSSAMLSEVKEIMEKNNLDFLAFVTPQNRLEGFLERRIFNKIISTKIMELQSRFDSLEAGGA